MKQVNLKQSALVFAVFILLNTIPAIGQNPSAPLTLNANQHIIKSSFNDKTYQLKVSLPNNYSITDTIHYPVLYVLDGKYSFTSFYSIREVLDLGKEIKDIIIVAIDGNTLSYPDWLANRFNDFTPGNIPQADSTWCLILQLPFGKLKSGGALSFVKTIEKDIMPFIDQAYKTSSDRGLFGHSLGGLFAGYCFLTRPGLFQQYSINSPSFWWNNGEMLALENSFIKQTAGFSANLFISVGSLEGSPMVSPTIAFTDSLKNHYNRSQITGQIFEDETHCSVVAAASSRTLKVFYGHKLQK